MSESSTAKRQWRVWSAKEDLEVFRMRPELFAQRYGRTLAAIKSRREYLRECRDHKKGGRYKPEQITARVVPLDVMSERNERLARQPRDLSAAVMGDPLPGYSALDKYQRDTVSA